MLASPSLEDESTPGCGAPGRFFDAPDAAAHDDVGGTRRLPAFEVVAWAATACTLVFLRACGLEMGWRALAVTTPVIVVETGVNFVLWGLPLHLLYRLLTRRSLREYLRLLLTPEWLLLTLRAWLACIAVFTAYAWLKVSIPLITETVRDDGLWSVDRLLHGGFSPNVLLVRWFGGGLVSRWIDAWYGIWITTTMAGSFFFFSFAGSRFRQRFLLSFFATWILGAWCYLAFPALGPVYAFPEVLDGVRGSIPAAEGLQRALGENYRIMTAARTQPIQPFNPMFGVAAFPSLHVGMHWLLTLWARRVAPRLFVPCLLATIVTFLGSVLTGWHYAVDGYAGVLLAHLCYRAALMTDRQSAILTHR